MFKKKEEDWNFWDDEPESSDYLYEENNKEVKRKEKNKNKKKKRFFKNNKNDEQKEESMWENQDAEVNYLDVESDNTYEKPEGFRISKVKLAICITIFSVIIVSAIGFTNTDFDENNKAYVVSYDLHYERDYVKTSDELYDYCVEVKEELKTLMPELANNSLSVINQINSIQSTLKAKTNQLSRYTEVPQMMSNYNDNLISFSLSTQNMLDTMLNKYTSSDYMAWAEAAYSDFCTSLQSLTYLRSQINEVIYRNVYQTGGE